MADKSTLFGYQQAGAALNNLADRYRAKILKSLRLATELTDRQVTAHLDSQDLPWKDLSPAFERFKESHGFSTDIYTMTTSYRQAIAINVDARRFIGFVGVLRPVSVKKVTGDKGDAGINMVQLGYVLEYGSEAAHISARPLWRPTLLEMRPAVRKLFGGIAGEVITK